MNISKPFSLYLHFGFSTIFLICICGVIVSLKDTISNVYQGTLPLDEALSPHYKEPLKLKIL